jgi:hypothetical protein
MTACEAALEFLAGIGGLVAVMFVLCAGFILFGKAIERWLP